MAAKEIGCPLGIDDEIGVMLMSVSIGLCSVLTVPTGAHEYPGSGLQLVTVSLTVVSLIKVHVEDPV